MIKYVIQIVAVLMAQTVLSQNFDFSVKENILTVIEKYDNGKNKIVANYIGKKLESINENNYQFAIDSKQIKLHGEFIKFHENGQIKVRQSYKKGNKVYDSYEAYTSNGEKVFTLCDVMPEYIEGEQVLFKTISDKVKSHPHVSTVGIVYVTFVIDKEGRITEVECLRGLNAEIDNIAIEAIKSLGLFTPGLIQGEPVNCAFNLPVRFEK